MIYTCTTNPSLDYYISLDEKIVEGNVIRSSYSHYNAGGKGVNVSIVLNNLNIPSVSLGFLGGFVKESYLSFLKSYPFIQPLFTSIEDTTRINVKLMGLKDETSINMAGPYIKDEEYDRFKKRLNNIYKGDYFVLSGLIQESIKDKIIELIHELANMDVNIVLDTNIEIINACLDVKPILVNLGANSVEGLEYTNVKEKLIELHKNGAINAIYVDPNKSSLIACEDGLFSIDKSNNEIYPYVGYTDSFIAGFIYATNRGGNSLEAMKYGEATCLSTTISNDLNTIENVETKINNLKVINEKAI